MHFYFRTNTYTQTVTRFFFLFSAFHRTEHTMQDICYANLVMARILFPLENFRQTWREAKKTIKVFLHCHISGRGWFFKASNKHIRVSCLVLKFHAFSETQTCNKHHRKLEIFGNWQCISQWSSATKTHTKNRGRENEISSIFSKFFLFTFSWC